MAKIIKKTKPAVLEVERSEKGIIMFPRYYIKAVGGHFSLEHRLTHTYITSVKTEEELVELVREWNSKTDEELWQYLIKKRAVFIPKQNEVLTNRYAHEEDWYTGAWGVYTTKFYEAHPELMVEVKSIDYNVISSIRQKEFEKSRAEEQAKREERERAEKAIIEEEKQKKVVASTPIEVPKPKPEGKKGLLKKRIKKIHKLENGVGLPELSINPFNPFD